MLSTSHLFFESKNENINNIRYLEYLQKYNIPKDECVLIGSALLRVHGLVDANEEIGVIVSPKVFDRLMKSQQFHKVNEDMYTDDDGVLEFGKELSVIDMPFSKLKSNAINIKGYYFISPRDLLKLYATLDRPKDQKNITLIKANFQKDLS